MPPEVTAEEWANMAQAATQPGIHFRPSGFRERLGSIGEALRDRKILGRPIYEIAADFGAGFAVKTAVRAGVVFAGAGTLGAIGAAVLAGAASGAVFSGGKEWLRQTRENWQAPLSPEAVTKKQQILERLKDLNPNDWKRLGKVTIRGAAVGAVFGLAGGIVADVFDSATPSGDSEPSAPVTEPSVNPEIPDGTQIPDDTLAPDGVSPVIPPAETPTGTVTPIPSSVPDTSATPLTETPTADQSAALPKPDSLPSSPEPATTVHPEIPTAQGEPAVPPADTTLPESSGATPAQPSDIPPTSPTDASAPPVTETPVVGETGAAIPPAEQLPASPPIETITESIENLKDIPLAAGSNPWEVATEILKQVDPNHVPTDGEIMEVTRAICEQNDISVPEWDINGSIDHHQIPIGYLIEIDDEVKSVIFDIMKAGK